MGRAGAGIVDLALEELVKLELPSLEEFVKQVKQELKPKRFECKRKDGSYEFELRGCPFAAQLHQRFGHNRICPVVILLAGVIKRESQQNVEIDQDFIEDGVKGRINVLLKSWLELLR